MSPRGVNQYVYNTHFIFHLIYAPFSLGKNRIARHWSISVLLLYLNFYSFDRYRESPLYFVLLFVSSVHLWCFPIITIPPSFLVPLGIKTPLYILITYEFLMLFPSKRWDIPHGEIEIFKFLLEIYYYLNICNAVYSERIFLGKKSFHSPRVFILCISGLSWSRWNIDTCIEVVLSKVEL